MGRRRVHGQRDCRDPRRDVARYRSRQTHGRHEGLRRPTQALGRRAHQRLAWEVSHLIQGVRANRPIEPKRHSSRDVVSHAAALDRPRKLQKRAPVALWNTFSDAKYPAQPETTLLLQSGPENTSCSTRLVSLGSHAHPPATSNMVQGVLPWSRSRSVTNARAPSEVFRYSAATDALAPSTLDIPSTKRLAAISGPSRNTRWPLSGFGAQCCSESRWYTVCVFSNSSCAGKMCSRKVAQEPSAARTNRDVQGSKAFVMATRAAHLASEK